jgi:hypothetical protein
MSRRAARLALAAVIGLIALSLLTGAAAGDGGGSNGAPKSLTHHFPLGSQSLSRTKTAPAGGSATTRRRTLPTRRHGGSAATPHQHRRRQPAHRQGGHGVSAVLFLLVIPVLIVAALVARVAIRRSRRTARRHARGRGRPYRPTRSTSHARWAYVDKDEIERQAPSLPVRRRSK